MPENPKKKDEGNESDIEFELEVHPAEDGAEQQVSDRKPADPREMLGNTKQKVSIASEDVKRRFKARLFSLKNHRTKKSAINLAPPGTWLSALWNNF